MPTEYPLYVRHEVYQRLANIRGRQRKEIMSFLATLERDPIQRGDYETTSPEGRTVQARILGSFALLFWADHAVAEIKVIDLVPADV